MPYGAEQCISPPPGLPHTLILKRLSRGLTLILPIVALIWAYLLLIPAPTVIETSNAGGQVYFSANRQVILNPGDCVTLRWQVDNIRAVYLNDEAQIGFGEKPMCINKTNDTPRLRVTFQDGSEQTYPLNILTLSTSLLTWIILILVFIFLILNRNQFQQLIQHRLRLISFIVSLIAIAGLFFAYLIPNAEIIAAAHWLDASNTLVNQITGLTLLALLLVVAFALIKTKPNIDDKIAFISGYPLIGIWAIGLLVTIGLITTTIITIDPLGMYFGSPYPSYQLLVRGLKTDGYNQLAQTPDMAIMGSSRAFTLSPTYIQDSLGYTAYNMAVEGGRIEDFLIQARQMRDFPKMLLIEVQEGLPRQPNDIAARAPLKWLPYMSTDTALLTIQKRLEGLLDINQFAEAIYTARYAPVYDHQPKEWPEFAPDGSAIRSPLSASELERAILVDIGNIPAERCDHVDDASQGDVNSLIQIAAEHHTSLIFYLSPWNPRYYDALLKDDPQSQQCHDLTAQYLQQLTEAHKNIFFLDYSHLDTIGGTADQSGYFDSQHLTAANSQRLLDHTTSTLDLAYHDAAQGG
ncbi:MAG: hypothetical protein ABI690_10945 [Chloroflexota bacterium]